MTIQESTKRLYQIIKSMPETVFIPEEGVVFDFKKDLEKSLQRMDINSVEIEPLNLGKEELIEKIEKEVEILQEEFNRLIEEKDPDKRRFIKEFLRLKTIGMMAKKVLTKNES